MHYIRILLILRRTQSNKQTMIGMVVQMTAISLCLIAVVHYLYVFFKTTLTVPKVKDLVNRPQKQYDAIFKAMGEMKAGGGLNGSNSSNSSTTSISSIPILVVAVAVPVPVPVPSRVHHPKLPQLQWNRNLNSFWRAWIYQNRIDYK